MRKRSCRLESCVPLGNRGRVERFSLSFSVQMHSPSESKLALLCDFFCWLHSPSVWFVFCLENVDFLVDVVVSCMCGLWVGDLGYFFTHS